MDVGRRIVDSYRRNRLEELLERRDFAGAAALLEPQHDSRLAAEAAAKRLNLDFAPSLHLLNQILARSGGATPDQLDCLYHDTDSLARGERDAVMLEVYWNARVKWYRGDYADFLGRVWRLMEAALQEAVGRLCGLDLTDEKRTRDDFDQWVRSIPDLFKFIEKQTTEKIDSNKQSAWLLGKVLEWFLKQDNQKPPPETARCAQAVKNLEPLRNPRNKSVLAHGF